MRLPAVVLSLAIALPAAVQSPGHGGQAPPFEEITLGVAVNDGGHSHAGSWGDFDADGDLDLFVANGIGGSVDFMYVNDGQANFSKVEAGDVVTLPRNSSSGRWVDYDADGDLDLFVAVLDGPVLQFRNDGVGGFTRITGSLVAGLDANSRKIGPADYDNDGDIDLLITQRHGNNNLLLQNRGNGTFERVTEGVLVSDGGDSTCVEWADVDADGDLDVFICNTGEANFLYRNDGSGRFERIASGSIVLDVGRTGSGSWGDFDGDGDLDLFTSNVAEQDNVMYRNDGGWSFTKIDQGAHVDDGGESNASNAVDVDNDGDLDLFVANVGGSNDLYLNDGRGGFSKVYDGPLVTANRVSASASWADYDRDGDLDVFISNLSSGRVIGGNNQIFRNDSSGNHWLHLRLAGTSSNSSGIGARVRLMSTVNGEDFWQLRELTGGVGNGTSGLELAYGLGEATTADSIIVRWPVGTVQVISDVASDRLLDIVEPRVDLVHIPVPPSRSNTSVVITADITDETASLLGVSVVYRQLGSSDYIVLEAVESPSGSYSAAIPVTQFDVEYYIEARFERFERFHGTAAMPHRIQVIRSREPSIDSVLDVEHDLGGQVSVIWFASALDISTAKLPFYSIWRALPAADPGVTSTAVADSEAAGFARSAVVVRAGLTWEWLSNQPALQLNSYAYTAETLYDRSEDTDGLHYFMVVAHTDDPDTYYLSEPVSGYSEGPDSGPPSLGNYPNPFNATTTISFDLSRRSEVSLVVYDLLGRPVREIVSGSLDAGSHEAVFEAGNLPSGIYPYVLTAGSFVSNRTLVRVK